MQKLVKTRKNTKINKQSNVKFWLNWIKYGAVSYSLYYGKNSERVIFSQKYMWHNTMKIRGILFQVYYFQVSVVWVWRSIVKRIPRINCLPWLKAVWRFRWVLGKYRQHASSIKSSNFVIFLVNYCPQHLLPNENLTKTGVYWFSIGHLVFDHLWWNRAGMRIRIH